MKVVQINAKKIPEKLKMRFKHKCEREGTTMSQKILDWIETYLKEGKADAKKGDHQGG